jgi:hypothetical protein
MTWLWIGAVLHSASFAPRSADKQVSSTTNKGQNMRINTATQLRKEITALDLALKMLRAETEGLRRSTITLKKAINAPLALWESHWFDALPIHEQEQINKTAKMIGNALKPLPTVVNQTVTSTTPAKTVKHTRKRSSAPARNARWTDKDDKALLRMVKIGQTHQQMSIAFGRSVGSIQQRIKILKKGK